MLSFARPDRCFGCWLTFFEQILPVVTMTPDIKTLENLYVGVLYANKRGFEVSGVLIGA